MRTDGVHFTRGGARIVAHWLAPQLEALVPPGPVFASRDG
jgi:lysophospholipase L1-like esterase